MFEPAEEGLSEYEGDLDEELLRPVAEQPSPGTKEESAIVFENRLQVPVELYWIDFVGKAVYYVTVKAGKVDRRETYEGHVWRVERVTEEGKAEVVACFAAGKKEGRVEIVEGMKDVDKVIEEGEEIEEKSREGGLDLGAGKPKEEKQAGAFVRDFNVWVRSAEREETQVSRNGTEGNPFDGNKVYTSPDGRFTVAWQYTPEQERKVYAVESSPQGQVQPRLKSFQYLKPGDKVRLDRPRMFDLNEKTEVATDDELFSNPYELSNKGWSTDGKEYRFLCNQRGHQVLRLVGMDTQGILRSVIEEPSKTFIDYSQKLYFFEITESEEAIWASERDGWNHLYLVDLTKGRIKNNITRGKWNLRSVDRADKVKRQIWFTALGVVKGHDPYYAQLGRVNFDGSGFILVTEGEGTHNWEWSPDCKYLVDTWSRVDLLPLTVVRDAETGKQIMLLEEGSLKELVGGRWTIPELFTATGRDDDTMIYGIIIRPYDFDANKKYAVIEHIYAGPHQFSTPKAFSLLEKDHELAELGFIVVRLDGMGTNWRGKAFHDRCYKDLKDAGLPDRIAWISAASRSRPWMDLDRVGIYGGSAGGQNALGALIWHGDFYKAAIADCGCHDNRMDKLWWNEQWTGWPVDKSYKDSSNVVHASKLKGALMLVVGELDDNVDPATTMQVVNALNEAEKDYELLFMPGNGHGVGSASPYAIRRQRDFLVRNLMGVQPPNRNSS